MLPNNGNVGLVLLIVCIGVSLALSGIRNELGERNLNQHTRLVATHVKSRRPEGRFLEPAYFAVNRKKFVLGIRGAATFFHAWRNCIEDGKSLATIESDDDQRKIEALIQRNDTDNFWIAATSLGLGEEPEGYTWVTTDRWVTMLPDDFELQSDACINLNSAGEWLNADCFDDDYRYSYICETYT